LAELTEDIKANGVQNPIATWFDKDEVEWLIDGRNRLDAMQAAGYRFSRIEHNASGVCTATKLKIRNPNQRKDVTGHDATALDNEWVGIHHYRETHTCGTFGMSIANPYELAVSYNIHRRHLTAAQKSELIGKLLKADPTKSDRAIAATAKVSDKTVGAKRAAMVASAEIPQLKARTGADGKTRKQPSKKTKAEKKELLQPLADKALAEIAEGYAIPIVKVAGQFIDEADEAVARELIAEEKAPLQTIHAEEEDLGRVGTPLNLQDQIRLLCRIHFELVGQAGKDEKRTRAAGMLKRATAAIEHAFGKAVS
jgi:hypothetical protein